MSQSIYFVKDYIKGQVYETADKNKFESYVKDLQEYYFELNVRCVFSYQGNEVIVKAFNN